VSIEGFLGGHDDSGDAVVLVVDDNLGHGVSLAEDGNVGIGWVER
jgi:hypothetical protein